MTNLEALKSVTEYRTSDDNLFTKVLLDNGVTGSGTYAAADEQSVDISAADLYGYLATHPDIAETGLSIKWDRNKLLQLRSNLYAKWGVALPETANRKATITGQPVTIDGNTYPVW
jgi:hypothetical protein